MPKKKDIWKQIILWLKNHHPVGQIDTWFSGTHLVELNHNLAVLQVPNKFVGTWTEESFSNDLLTAFRTIFGFTPQLHFTIRDDQAGKTHKRSGIKARAQDRSHSKYTFIDFITDSSNRFAYLSALDFSNKSKPPYNPLYIFGEHSTGKTHLICAIANNMITKEISGNPSYIRCDTLYREFSAAKRNHTMAEFWGKIYGSEVLLLDNIEMVSGKYKLQLELLRLIDHFLGLNRHIAIAGKTAPSKMTGLKEELVSRLEGGLLTEIKAPSQSTKVKLLKKRAEKDNVSLPEDVIFFLATISEDIQILYEYYTRVTAQCSLYSKKLDLSIVKRLIQSPENRSVSIQRIQAITANYFEIPIGDLLSTDKKRCSSFPRQIAMYLAKEYLGLSYKQIADAFFRKDHSTVVYSVKRIRRLKEQDSEVKKHVNHLYQLLV